MISKSKLSKEERKAMEEYLEYINMTRKGYYNHWCDEHLEDEYNKFAKGSAS
ncbi:hypothetical protein [Rummeliibacillus sp. POC4]|uniref:hypothetical protein n=1 Tax=Rummeliibacillus sp. POC4 TaxID=2305899 RepID=UPI001315009C|nr:hypothetical protein [Rummeliibacillus sp. POC4]